MHLVPPLSAFFDHTIACIRDIASTWVDDLVARNVLYYTFLMQSIDHLPTHLFNDQNVQIFLASLQCTVGH